VLVLVFQFGASACGDDAPMMPDTGSPDAGPAANVTPPDVPWLDDGIVAIAPPSFLPCPSGWAEVVDGELTTCDPGTEAGVNGCAVGEARFLGESACTPVGDACPAGDFAEGLPADGSVIFVQTGAVSGDGTRALPYGSLSDVSLSTLAPGTTVALAKGTYEGVLSLRAGVRVVGACAAETSVTGLSAPVQSVISVTSAGEPAEVRNLSIANAPQTGAQVVGAGRSLNLSGVIVRAASGVGLSVDDGGEIVATDIVIRDTRTDGGRFGRAVNVQNGGSVALSRAVLSSNTEISVFATNDGSLVTALDTVIRETRESGGAFGRALLVQLGAEARLERVLVTDNHDRALIAAGTGTLLGLDSVIVRGTRAAGDGDTGGGILAFEGAAIEGTRIVVEGNRVVGVECTSEGTSVVMNDLVVRDTEARERDDIAGRGVIVEAGASFVGSRVVVARNREIGVQVDGAPSSATLTDLVIRDTLPIVRDGTFGMGLVVRAGGWADATRMLVERSRVVGILVDGATSAISLEDVVVRDIEADEATSHFGRGLNVQDGSLEASRVLLERTRESAIFVAGEGARATLDDAIVRDTRSQLSDGRGGKGLMAQGGAHVEVARAVIERSLGMGVVSLSGAVVMLEDVRVTDTAARDCASTTCAESPFGYGVATWGGTVGMSRFVCARAVLCGVFVDDGELDLANGEVTGAEIGACVQSESYDVARLTDQVEYRDNGANLDVTALPVPEPAAALR